MTYIDPSDLIKNPELDDNKLHLSNNYGLGEDDNYLYADYGTSEDDNHLYADYGTSEDDNYLYAASTTEMTGLAPTVAHNEYEAQSYEEVYPYLPPVPPQSQKHSKKNPIE